MQTQICKAVLDLQILHIGKFNLDLFRIQFRANVIYRIDFSSKRRFQETIRTNSAYCVEAVQWYYIAFCGQRRLRKEIERFLHSRQTISSRKIEFSVETKLQKNNPYLSSTQCRTVLVQCLEFCTFCRSWKHVSQSCLSSKNK